MVFLLPVSARAEDTLWKLDFSKLTPGQALTGVPYEAPCAGPQKVTTDSDNTLVGAKAVGSLVSPLVFDKETATHYTPSFTLKALNTITTGTITVNLDVLFDRISPSAVHPVETLMAFPFINGQGGSDYIPVIACNGAAELSLGAAGLTKGKTLLKFKVSEVAHIKAVLDLDNHTFQIFLNGVPYADAEHDDQKFSTFLGLTVRDGTALGGNNGATFTAGIANLVVTHS